MYHISGPIHRKSVGFIDFAIGTDKVITDDRVHNTLSSRGSW